MPRPIKSARNCVIPRCVWPSVKDVIERQTESLVQREKNIDKRQKELERRHRNIDTKDKQLNGLIVQQKNQLLKITAMDIEEAKKLLLQRLEDECEHEMSGIIKRKVEEAHGNRGYPMP